MRAAPGEPRAILPGGGAFSRALDAGRDCSTLHASGKDAQGGAGKKE